MFRYSILLVLLITSSIVSCCTDERHVNIKRTRDLYIDMDEKYAKIKVLPINLTKTEMLTLDFLDANDELSDRFVLRVFRPPVVNLWYIYLR